MELSIAIRWEETDVVKLEIRKNTYYDSVTLMIISKDVKNLSGVSEALVGMGTDLNREIAGNLGLDADGFEDVTANDFFVAADCDDENCFKKVVEKVDELLNKQGRVFPADSGWSHKSGKKSEHGSDFSSGTFCGRCCKRLPGS